MESRNLPAVLVVSSTALIGASSGHLGGALFAIIGGVVGVLWGIGLVTLARMISRTEPRREAWASGTLFATVVTADV